jgi:hypothetical protein
MSRRRRLAVWLPLLGVLALAAPQLVAAHAIGGTFQLPVPRELYFAAAAAAVAASFVVAVLVLRPAGPVPAYRVLPLPARASRAASVVLAILGLAWWAWAIWAAFVIDGFSSVPGVLFWIVLWVGLPIVAITLGNPWPSFSPFRTIHRLLQRGTALLGVRRLDLGLPYPAGLRRWPAVALLFAAVWAELVLPASSAAGTVGVLLGGYTVLTIAGMLVLGPIAWLRNAELFEVLLGWFGRIGPVGRRTLDAAVCDGCADGCDPLRCIDCPECAVVADPGERRAELRPWFAGLAEIHRPGWSDVVFIILALAGVTFDGLHETTVWSGFLQLVNEPLGTLLGTGNADLAAGTLGLLLTWVLFVAAFSLAAWLTRMTSTQAHWRTFEALAAAYAATLLPIAGGYLIAHYLTLFIQGIVWVPELVVDPNASVAPLLDAIPIAFEWYLSVGANVIGHIAGIVLALRLALRDVPRARFLAALPLVLLMVGYTVLSLWIIAQPITLNPG